MSELPIEGNWYNSNVIDSDFVNDNVGTRMGNDKFAFGRFVQLYKSTSLTADSLKWGQCLANILVQTYTINETERHCLFWCFQRSCLISMIKTCQETQSDADKRMTIGDVHSSCVRGVSMPECVIDNKEKEKKRAKDIWSNDISMRESVI